MRAGKTAHHIISFIKPCLILVWSSEGGIDAKLKDDMFILGYVYGVIAAFLEGLKVTDQEEAGYSIQQVFERLFPGQGRPVTEICNQYALQKSPEFMRSTRLGFSEMIETFEIFDLERDRQEQKILESLLHYVSNIACEK